MDKDVAKLFNTFQGITHDDVPMGILPYDILAGGSIQLGSCIAIGGAEGAGKSTAFMHMCKSLIETQGRNVCYVDAEKSGAFMKQLNSFDLRKHSQFADGFDWNKELPKLWWVNSVNTYGEFQSLCKQLIALKQQGKVNYEYIILDSVSALTQTKMIDGDCEAAAVAYDALPISKLIKAVRGILYNAGITLCFVAQASSNIGAGLYDPEWTLKLTRSIRHCCDLLYVIEKPDYKKYKIFETDMSLQGQESDIEVGYLAKVWTIKNRAVRSQKMLVPYIYGKGVDNIRFLMGILGSSGYVTSRMYQGVERFKFSLTKDPNDTQVLEGWDNYKAFIVHNYDAIVKYLYDCGQFDLGSKNYMITAETDDVEVSDEMAEQLDSQAANDDVVAYANDNGQDTTEPEHDELEAPTQSEVQAQQTGSELVAQSTEEAIQELQEQIVEGAPVA